MSGRRWVALRAWLVVLSWVGAAVAWIGRGLGERVAVLERLLGSPSVHRAPVSDGGAE